MEEFYRIKRLPHYVFAEVDWLKTFEKIGAIAFLKILLPKASTATSPGIGFGEYGQRYVRFGLVENEPIIRQTNKNIKKVLLSSRTYTDKYYAKNKNNTK
jgi:alanine-synthesizing transaminase